MRKIVALAMTTSILAGAAAPALADDCFNVSRAAGTVGDTKGNWTYYGEYGGMTIWGFSYPDNHGTENAGRYAIRQDNPPATCGDHGIQHFDVCFGAEG